MARIPVRRERPKKSLVFFRAPVSWEASRARTTPNAEAFDAVLAGSVVLWEEMPSPLSDTDKLHFPVCVLARRRSARLIFLMWDSGVCCCSMGTALPQHHANSAWHVARWKGQVLQRAMKWRSEQECRKEYLMQRLAGEPLRREWLIIERALGWNN